MLSFVRRTIGHFVLMLAAISIPAAAEDGKYRFPTQSLTACTRVESIIEVAGRLNVNPNGKQTVEVPLSGKGEFQYHERPLSAREETSSPRAIRYYSLAKAAFRVGQRDSESRLSDERRLVRVDARDSKITMFSPLGPLKNDELELIDIQGNSAILDQLLPETEIGVGEKWKHSDRLIAMLLGLEVVTETTVESRLSKVESNTAYFEMSGVARGSVGGINSDIEVTGKFQCRLDEGLVRWLALSLQEKRAVGHAEPGFEVTARIRVGRSPIAPSDLPPELNDEAIATLPAEANEGTTAISYDSGQGAFRLVHDRNWHVMVDRHDVTILRWIDAGELIAQCNISRLPDAAPDKLLSMQSFQADIRRVLDKNFGQFADATQSQNEKGIRMLRVVVAGVAADLPIQWNYYHLTDRHGRQLTLVFTLESSLVAKFGAADQLLVESLELDSRPAPPPASSDKTTANAATRSPDSGSKR